MRGYFQRKRESFPPHWLSKQKQDLEKQQANLDKHAEELNIKLNAAQNVFRKNMEFLVDFEKDFDRVHKFGSLEANHSLNRETFKMVQERVKTNEEAVTELQSKLMKIYERSFHVGEELRSIKNAIERNQRRKETLG